VSNSSASLRVERSWWRAIAGVALFTLGFAVADRFPLVHGVVYFLEGHDTARAIRNFALHAGQALALLGALALLPRRWAYLALTLAFVSILVNLGYGQTVNDTLDPGKLAWIGEEARQARQTAGQFAGPLLWALVQAALATTLFALAHHQLYRAMGKPRSTGLTIAGLTLLLLPNVALLTGLQTAGAADRNLYTYGYAVLTDPLPPPRAPVDLAPDQTGSLRHIVWLIDESVAYEPFTQIVLPSTSAFDPVDFGEAVSMSNCSAPSNFALRSGVDVRHAGPAMDLRTTPSIWGYAKAANYRTLLIDGQTTGPPQNMLLPPERALIDEALSIADGIDTDRTIAAKLNAQIKGKDRTFTYVVLRGVHYQFKNHYPPGTLPDDATEIEQYRAALAYSKDRFFSTLLDGVDRDEVAVVYTSDHGQNLTPGKLPHCSQDRVPAEYDIPLLAFLPAALAERYDTPINARHSASQILPTTLEWMGYDLQAVQARYDRDLSQAPAAYVQFGRTVVPLGKDGRIDVDVAQRPPGTQ